MAERRSTAPPPAAAGPKGPPLGEVLLQHGVITPEQLADAVVRQVGSGKRLGDLLREMGIVQEKDVVTALASQMSLPLVDLRTMEPDPAVASRLSESIARSLRAIPVQQEPDGTIVVAACDPNPNLERELSTALGTRVKIVLGTTSEVMWAVDRAYPALAHVDAQVAQFTAQHGQSAQPSATTAAAADGSSTPIVRVTDMIITQALRDRASDIHLEPYPDRLRVRFRIDGVLHDVLALPSSMAPAICSRLKILAGMSIVERRRPQDGQFTISVEGSTVDMRVATTGVLAGEKMVMRLLDKTKGLMTLEDLGMTGGTLQAYRALLGSPFGMILCAGPTGSGKTTSLYASLNDMNSTTMNVTTIEDPVEYVYPSVNQIQINEAAGITFAAGLRSILRQDPDTILVGEIRDLETASIAIQAALTGHFVLSSVHATDAVSSVYRFIEMGIEPFLVAASMIGVVGQRLVRRNCEHCLQAYQPSPDELAYFRRAGGDPAGQFLRGAGCNYCSRTGYVGRIGVYELLALTPEMKEVVVQPGSTHAMIREVARSQGMRTMAEDGARLVGEGKTTIAEIVRAIYTL